MSPSYRSTTAIFIDPSFIPLQIDSLIIIIGNASPMSSLHDHRSSAIFVLLILPRAFLQTEPFRTFPF